MKPANAPVLEVPQMTFDYATLQAESRIVVQQKTAEIRERVKRAAEDIVAIGERLLIVKGHLEHGQFGRWLSAEFQWNESSARRMMAVASKFKTLNLSDIVIGPSALYLLASDSIPDEIRNEVIETAKAGAQVTHATVKARIEADKPPIARVASVRRSAADAQPTYDDDAQAEPGEPAVAVLDEEEPASDEQPAKTEKPGPTRRNGNYEDTLTMTKVLKEMGVLFDSIKDLKPKRDMATTVADEARRLAGRLQRLVTGIEKEY